MGRTSVNFRMDSDLKKDIEEVCEEMGMNITTVFTVFAKKLVRERKIPFEIDADPFYSKKNLKRLEKSIKQMENGGGTVHEVDYD